MIGEVLRKHFRDEDGGVGVVDKGVVDKGTAMDEVVMSMGEGFAMIFAR